MYKHLNVGKRTQRNETTAKDRFVVSFNAFLFLLYPHSCKVLLSIFSCKYIGDDYYHSYDVSVRCYNGSYFIFLLLFGIPLTILYIIGLPSTVFYFLRKHLQVCLHIYLIHYLALNFISNINA